MKSSEESTKEAMEMKCSEESTEESMKIKIFEEDENTTDWFDRNKFKNVLVIIDSFNHSFKLTDLITKMKLANLSIMTLKTWLIKLEIIQ